MTRRPPGPALASPYRSDQPSYAGGATYCRVPLVALEEIHAGQVVVLGAPTDEGAGTRPGARFGPRAIRLADDGAGSPSARRHLDLGVRPFAVLDVVDAGDLPVVTGDPEHNLALIERAVAGIVRRGATPLVLGGDHSIAGATIRGVASASGPPQVVQFDAHADTAQPGRGRPPWNHGVPFRRLIDEGVLAGASLTQVGLRGWWPGAADLDWARERGVAWWTARDVRRRGMTAVVDAVLERLDEATPVWLSIDIDVVDPGFAPGTGTPEPGGLPSWDLLDAVLEIACRRPLAGCELVEVLPAYDQSETTAMLAHRLLLEALSGMACRSARTSP